MEMTVIMPSEGDMELVGQEGGSIKLKPVFYGNESMGPHIVVNGPDGITMRYKLKLKRDGKIELKKGD